MSEPSTKRQRTEWPDRWPVARAAFNAALFASPSDTVAGVRVGVSSTVHSNENWNKDGTQPEEQARDSQLMKTKKETLAFNKEVQELATQMEQEPPTADELVRFENASGGVDVD